MQSPRNQRQEAFDVPNLPLTMDIVLETAWARKTSRGGWKWEDWVRKGETGGEKSSLPGPAVQAQLVQAAVWDL